MSLFSTQKITAQLIVEDMEDGGVALRSDRLFVAFQNQDALDKFAKREGVKNFLSKLHNPTHANRAGFVLVLSDYFGKPHNKSCQLAVYAEAMNVDPEIYGNLLVLADKMTNDDVADCFLLMTRKWAIFEGTDFGTLDGSFEKFRELFMDSSYEPGDLEESDAVQG